MLAQKPELWIHRQKWVWVDAMTCFDEFIGLIKEKLEVGPT
jgi:hypothetical protein